MARLLLKKGNGNQIANHAIVMDLFENRITGVIRVNNSTLKIDEKLYHVSYSAEPEKLMLANTKQLQSSLPSWMLDIDGLLAIRQFKDGRLGLYRFETPKDLWENKDGGVAISWDVARTFAEKPEIIKHKGK